MSHIDPDAPVPTRCDHCGQFDDHPKLHYGEATYHHDTACLPLKVRQDIGDNASIAAITAAADSGIHGHALRAHIVELFAPVENTED